MSGPALKHTFKLEYRRLKKARYRTNKAGGKSKLSLTAWLNILTSYDWACAFCKKKEITLEHLVPLRMGGGTDVKNCVPACDFCNNGFEYSSKHGVN